MLLLAFRMEQEPIKLSLRGSCVELREFTFVAHVPVHVGSASPFTSLQEPI